MPREMKSENSAEVTEADIANIVKEEIAVMADKIIREEVEKEIEEKISGKKISASRRLKIFQKVSEDVRKQVPELLEKIAKDQMKSTEENDEERRVSEEIRKEIAEKIQSVVHRSMEKAIADEIFERVKFDKLSRTPTIEPKLGIGVRHAQVLMVFFFLAISYLQRTDLSLAIVAMTNRDQANKLFQEFDWDEPTVGFLLSSFYWGYFILQIPGGIIAERFSPKSVMAYSMVFCSTCCICMPAATILGGWVGLYIMKIVLGIGQATFIPAVYVFVARWIPPNEKSRLFTPAFGGMQMGTVVGLPIAGILCSSPVGWPAVFFFSGIVGFVWAVVWIFVAANSPAVHRSISREEQLYIEGSFGFGEITVKGVKKMIPWRPILTSPPFWALMCAHFGQNWGFFTLFTKMPAFISSVLQVEIRENSFLNSMSFLVGWILIVIFGFLSSIIHEKALIPLEAERKIWNSIAFYGGGIGFFAIAYSKTTSLSIAMLLMTFVLSTNSAVYNGFFSNHADLSPNYVGILMALSNCLGNLAALAAPIFVAEVVKDPKSVQQWSVVFYTAGAIMVATNTIFVIFGSSEIQSWNTPSDLHLQLQDDIPPRSRFGFSRRRNQGNFVSNIDLSDIIPPDAPTEKIHRRSI